jgi:anti-sigma regulatory factor (Ser/Thr protein kinase)
MLNRSANQWVHVANVTAKTPVLLELFYAWKTRTALYSTVSEQILSDLETRCSLDDDLRFRLQLCLHEALANALIHGNLDMHDAVDSLEAFDAREDTITKRLASPQFAEKMIYLVVQVYQDHLRITLRDDGNGLPEKKKEEAPKEHAFGRGQTLLEEFADYQHYHQATTTLELCFYQRSEP